MPTVIIFDPVPTETLLIKNCFQSADWKVIVPENSLQLFDYTRTRSPDVILLDIIQKEENGFGLCKKIKDHPETANVPVILLSSRSHDSDRFWGLHQGAADFIIKPNALEELLEAAQQQLSA